MQYCSCSVFTIYIACNVISPVKFGLCFYISTSRGMCTVPKMAVVRSSLISCFPGVLLRYCVSDYEMVPVATFIADITFASTFHML